MSETTTTQSVAAEGPATRIESASQSGVGVRLAMEREARSWSVEQVAKQLNLAPRQIQALEADNYAALPGTASVRGFVRAYAKLLKMDAAPLMDMMPAEAPALVQHQLSTPFFDSHRLPAMGDGRASSKLLVAGIAAIVLLATVFVGYQMGWIQSPAPISLQGVKEQGAVPAAGSAKAAVDISSRVTPVADPSAPTVTVDSASIPHDAAAANSIGAVGTALAAKPVLPGAGAPSEPAATTVAGKNNLVLKVREDSWVEIRRAGDGAHGSGQVLLARLAKAGSSETFEVTEPISLTVGNAAGVDATLRGAHIDLSSEGKGNVAHLDLK